MILALMDRNFADAPKSYSRSQAFGVGVSMEGRRKGAGPGAEGSGHLCVWQNIGLT